MTDKELKHMRKKELLQLMLRQQKRIEQLESELSRTQTLLNECENSITRLHSLNASASSITEVLSRSVESFVVEYRRLTKAALDGVDVAPLQELDLDLTHEAE